jgi:hypothetical protein
MAVQDWYGLEGWKAVLDSHWVELPWWVGAMICVGALGCHVFNMLDGKPFKLDDLRITNHNDEPGWPWCEACQSWHHPENTTCVKRRPQNYI